MRKLDNCLCENNGAGQLLSNCEASFAVTAKLICVTAKLICAFVFATRIEQFLLYLYPKFQAASCHCTGMFVSDLVNLEDRFSRVAANLVLSECSQNPLYIHL